MIRRWEGEKVRSEDDRIIDTLRRFFADRDDVMFAYLFGSVARGDVGPLSDIDIAVMCDDCETRIQWDLMELLGREDIDVVNLRTLRSQRLVKDIVQEGVLLKEGERRAQWEVDAYHKALDFIQHAKVVYGY